MKKELIIKIFVTILMLITLIIGTKYLFREYISSSRGKVNIQVIDINGNLVINDFLEFKKGDTLLNILEEHYEIRSDDSWGSTFIYDINNVTTDGYNFFFTIYVNEKTSLVGIEQIELVDGVIIKFEVTRFDSNYEE